MRSFLDNWTSRVSFPTPPTPVDVSGFTRNQFYFESKSTIGVEFATRTLQNLVNSRDDLMMHGVLMSFKLGFRIRWKQLINLQIKLPYGKQPIKKGLYTDNDEASGLRLPLIIGPGT